MYILPFQTFQKTKKLDRLWQGSEPLIRFEFMNAIVQSINGAAEARSSTRTTLVFNKSGM